MFLSVSECDSCVHLLLDDMMVLERQLADAERELSNITISYLAYKRLSQINDTVIELQVRSIVVKILKDLKYVIACMLWMLQNFAKD